MSTVGGSRCGRPTYDSGGPAIIRGRPQEGLDAEEEVGGRGDPQGDGCRETRQREMLLDGAGGGHLECGRGLATGGQLGGGWG